MARRTWEQYERYLLQRWPLTLREVQVAIQCVKGNKNREIALALDISSETVNKHLDRIYRVIGVRGRDQLVAELLIADIDNTPLQQSLSLSGEGASAVASGFMDTLYASRGERKRPRSPSNASVERKSGASRSRSVSAASPQAGEVTSMDAGTADAGTHASLHWVEGARLAGPEHRALVELVDADRIH